MDTQKTMAVIVTPTKEEGFDVEDAITGRFIEPKVICPPRGLEGLLNTLSSSFSSVEVIILSSDVFCVFEINIISVVKAVRKQRPDIKILVYRNENTDEFTSEKILEAGANCIYNKGNHTHHGFSAWAKKNINDSVDEEETGNRDVEDDFAGRIVKAVDAIIPEVSTKIEPKENKKTFSQNDAKEVTPEKVNNTKTHNSISHAGVTGINLHDTEPVADKVPTNLNQKATDLGVSEGDHKEILTTAGNILLEVGKLLQLFGQEYSDNKCPSMPKVKLPQRKSAKAPPQTPSPNNGDGEVGSPEVIEVTQITKGSCRVTLENKTFTLPKGAAYLLKIIAEAKGGCVDRNTISSRFNINPECVPQKVTNLKKSLEEQIPTLGKSIKLQRGEGYYYESK